MSDGGDVPALLLGNGPSLAQIDLASDTDGYHTFGMNAAYRHWAKIGWWPTYYSCLDTVVGESHFDAIEKLVTSSQRNGIRRFLLRRNISERLPATFSQVIDCYEDLVNVGRLPPLSDITTGSHTLLWAQYLGYLTILIAGVDLNYVEQVDQSELVDGVLHITGEGQNPNYFFDGYQQPGDTYNIPNPRPNLHTESWANAAAKLRFPTIVINLNQDSMLKTFAKNTSDGVLQPGLVTSSETLLPLRALERLNKQKHDTVKVREFVGRQIEPLTKRDIWSEALVSQNLNAFRDKFALIYLPQRRRFVFLEARLELKLPDPEIVVVTDDIRLLDQIIRELEKIAIPSATQRLGKAVRHSFGRVVNVLPRRLRRVSVYDNVRDMSSYYRSVRGITILVLQSILAYIISPPPVGITTFLITWSVLIILFPLAHRRL